MIVAAVELGGLVAVVYPVVAITKLAHLVWIGLRS